MDTLYKGCFVTYIPTEEIGRVKSVDKENGTAFVVYDCDNEWDTYEEYLGKCTKITDMELIDMHEVHTMYNYLSGGVCSCNTGGMVPCSYCENGGSEGLKHYEKIITTLEGHGDT